MHHPTDRIAHTTVFVTPVVKAGMRNSSMGPARDHLLLERVAYVVAAGFLSHYVNGPLPYVRCHITVK